MAVIRLPFKIHTDAEEPLVLEALESDQVVAGRRRWGRRPLTRAVQVAMWGLRVYLVLMLAVAGVQIFRVLHGG